MVAVALLIIRVAPAAAGIQSVFTVYYHAEKGIVVRQISVIEIKRVVYPPVVHPVSYEVCRAVAGNVARCYVYRIVFLVKFIFGIQIFIIGIGAELTVAVTEHRKRFINISALYQIKYIGVFITVEIGAQYFFIRI